jgi:hypothetical protein
VDLAWHSSQTFVLPDSVIGDDGVWFQLDKKIAAYGKAGRMEDLRQLVAARACGNPFLIFCLCFAFCGPLLERLGSHQPLLEIADGAMKPQLLWARSSLSRKPGSSLEFVLFRESRTG